jgi:hypothetical protein
VCLSKTHHLITSNFPTCQLITAKAKCLPLSLGSYSV